MKNFEELAFEWYDTICFSDKYAYRTEKMNAIKHLVSFFGKMNCEAIKSADVDRFIKYESEHLNPNNGKPYSKRLNYQHYCDTMRQLGRTPQGYEDMKVFEY